MKRRAPFVLVIALAAGAVWLLVARPWSPPGPLVASGTIEAHQVLVGSRVGGRVAKVHVREGDRVRAGQVIAEIEPEETVASRAAAEAAVASARASLEALLAGSRPEEIARARAQAEAARQALEALRTWPRKEELEAARADLEAARADLANAEAQHRRVEELTRSGVASAADLDAARSARDAGRAKVESLREHLRVHEAGSRPEDIRAAEARLADAEASRALVEKGPRQEDIDRGRAALREAEARLAVLDQQLEEMVVRSPGDAIVEVFDTRPGDLAGAGKPLATLIEPDLWVRVYIPENRLGLVRVGEEVTVRVDSYPGRDFAGAVERVHRKAEFTPRNVQTPEERVNQVFGVRVRLPDPEGMLRAGMAADVTFPSPAQASPGSPEGN